jgi:hypothetical protein
MLSEWFCQMERKWLFYRTNIISSLHDVDDRWLREDATMFIVGRGKIDAVARALKAKAPFATVANLIDVSA